MKNFTNPKHYRTTVVKQFLLLSKVNRFTLTKESIYIKLITTLRKMIDFL